MKVMITGAAGRIAYSLIPLIGNGNAFGDIEMIDLVLLDIPACEKQLQGVCMEIEDSNFPMIKSAVYTTVPEIAFMGVDLIIFLGAIPRLEGMERVDLLKANKNIFKEQAELMDKFCHKDVRALVVGNPANTNALILIENTKSIQKENITSLMRLDQNRAISMVSRHLKIKPRDVKNLVVWGNHSATQIPSTENMKINNETFVSDDEFDYFYTKRMKPEVRSRGHTVITFRGSSSAFSAAQAICDHIRDWFLGTKTDTIVSMGVCSDGSYDVSSGLVFGMPCRCLGKFKYEIVKDLIISENLKDEIKKSAEELEKEKEMASK